MELSGRRDLMRFIFLPENIHKGQESWVHPLYIDEWTYFNPKWNKSFKGCDTVLALAWQGDKPVGRIMGIINRSYNKKHNEQNARFSYLECYRDIEIARALIGFVTDWASKHGMKKLLGPLGFSDKDPQGCMIEGFDERVTLVTNHNHPWMEEFYEELGFRKEIDMVSYISPVTDKVPEYIETISKRVMQSGRYKLLEFNRRRALKPWIVPIFRLVNETYSHLFGFIEMTEEEMHEMARRYLPLLNPRFVKVITTADGEVAAFLISMPELSDGIRRARGRLFPFGWFHILRESRRSDMLTLLLGAVKVKYRGLGLETLLGMKIYESAISAGIKAMDSHLILETNSPMRDEFERLPHRLHKRFRVFSIEI